MRQRFRDSNSVQTEPDWNVRETGAGGVRLSSPWDLKNRKRQTRKGLETQKTWSKSNTSIVYHLVIS